MAGQQQQSEANKDHHHQLLRNNNSAWIAAAAAGNNINSNSNNNNNRSGSWRAPARHTAAADDDSWEVRAFAEDAASCSGQWPPRSYSCSFCAREFRTAQALGGHMNVHRRERAYANQLGLISSKSSSAAAAAAAVAAAAAAANPAVNPPESSAACAAAAPPPPPALGFCWVYPYNPGGNRPPAIHMHPDHVYPAAGQQQNHQIQHQIPQIPTTFSPQIMIGNELSLSPPNSSACSLSSSISASLNSSSGSDSSTESLTNAAHALIKCPDLSALKLLVVESNHDQPNALDLELRLGHSRH